MFCSSAQIILKRTYKLFRVKETPAKTRQHFSERQGVNNKGTEFRKYFKLLDVLNEDLASDWLRSSAGCVLIGPAFRLRSLIGLGRIFYPTREEKMCKGWRIPVVDFGRGYHLPIFSPSSLSSSPSFLRHSPPCRRFHHQRHH